MRNGRHDWSVYAGRREGSGHDQSLLLSGQSVPFLCPCVMVCCSSIRDSLPHSASPIPVRHCASGSVTGSGVRWPGSSHAAAAGAPAALDLPTGHPGRWCGPSGGRLTGAPGLVRRVRAWVRLKGCVPSSRQPAAGSSQCFPDSRTSWSALHRRTNHRGCWKGMLGCFVQYCWCC